MRDKVLDEFNEKRMDLEDRFLEIVENEDFNYTVQQSLEESEKLLQEYVMLAKSFKKENIATYDWLYISLTNTVKCLKEELNSANNTL